MKNSSMCQRLLEVELDFHSEEFPSTWVLVYNIHVFHLPYRCPYFIPYILPHTHQRKVIHPNPEACILEDYFKGTRETIKVSQDDKKTIENLGATFQDS
jgi:hypothetical protein